MSEEEAKKKWCPFARPSEMSALRYVDTTRPQHTLCIASVCMSWRWVPRTRKGGVNEGYADIPATPTEGYCGLAGKP